MVEKSINLATEEYVNNTVAGLSNRIDILTELVDVPPVYTKPSLSLSLSFLLPRFFILCCSLTYKYIISRMNMVG